MWTLSGPAPWAWKRAKDIDESKVGVNYDMGVDDMDMGVDNVGMGLGVDVGHWHGRRYGQCWWGRRGRGRR